MRAFRDFQISIRTALSVGTVAVVLLTAVIVHVPWWLTSRADITDLNTRVNELVIASIADKVDRLLDDAVAARQAIATILINGTDIDDEARRQLLFLSFLQSQPGLTSIEFGWPDNHSYLVYRVADGAIRIEETIPAEPELLRRTDIYRARDSDDFMLERRETSTSDYRVSEQFWFMTAFDKDKPAWTNIYRLPSSGTLGVTTTTAVERNGGLIGVLGISISLDRLSAFLNGIDVSAHGAVFLTNVYGELVAVQRRMHAPSDNAIQPSAISKLEDAEHLAVRIAVAAMKASAVELGSLDRGRQLAFRDKNTGETYFVTLAPLSQMGLVVAVVLPEADVLGVVDSNIELLAIVLAAFILIVGLAATLVARRAVGRPLAQVTANLARLEDFRLDGIMPTPSHLVEINRVSAATQRMSTSLASFQKYIPTELVRTLFARGIEAELGGEGRDLTILFMDIANFTAISEQLSDGIVDFLGDYLSEMSALIQQGEGTIDKYIGDAIMAFWGAPVPSGQHALQACRAAVNCQAYLAEARRARRGTHPFEIRVRVGVNTGRVVVGNFGSRNRLNYTVIGDPVNVASRLESLNKLYGTEIIIGQRTFEEARDHIVVRPLDRVAVYGKDIGLDMYELLGFKGEAEAVMMDWLDAYEAGRAALRARQWDRAIDLFGQVIARRGGRDSVSSVQIARAQAFRLTPPPDDWDGLVILDSK